MIIPTNTHLQQEPQAAGRRTRRPGSPPAKQEAQVRKGFVRSVRSHGLTAIVLLLAMPLSVAWENSSEVEPNDSCGQADALAGRESSYTGTISANSDVDTVKLTAYKTETVSWTIYDGTSSTAVWAGWSPACPASGASDAGSFYVYSSGDHYGTLVRGYGGTPINYRLDAWAMSNDAGSGGDAPNGPPGMARTGPFEGALTPPDHARSNTAGATDEDWYRFSVPSLGGATVTMTPERSDFDLTVLDPSGASVSSTRGSNSVETIVCTSLLGGEYKVRIYPYGSSYAGGYTAAITITTIGPGLGCRAI